jgi:5-deoxy-D-glucuronate isomerase
VAVAEQDETAELSPSGSSSSKNNTETQVQIEQAIAKENMTLQESSPRQQRIQHNISLSPQKILASNIDTDSVGVSSLPVHKEDDYDDNNEMSA